MAYYLKKIGGFLLTILLVSLLTFAVFNILPGDPAVVILGVDADEAQVEALNQSMHLDLPLGERYLLWLKGLLVGDLGTSYRYRLPVSQLIRDGFSVTAGLAVLSIALSLAIALPLGIFLARHKDSRLVLVLNMLSQIGISVPSFCMGILLITIFSVKLKWLPSMGYTPFSESPLQWFRSMLLPALSIALGTSAVLVRYIRVSILSQYHQDYVRTARSKGMSENRVLHAHVLRNSLIPVITILGMTIGSVLGGSIIIENVFSLPGIGKLVSTSISTRDLPLIQGLVVYLAFIVLCCNFAADTAYSLIDPRIRMKQRDFS